MTYQSFTVSRFIGDDAEHGTTFTVADDDAVNVAHMLAAGFNTMSRNMLSDFVLAVVDKKAGVVYYDGKTETINRDEPWSVSQSFNFEGSTRVDTLLTFFGLDEQTATALRGNVKADEPVRSDYAHVAREVLEEAYADYTGIRERMYEAGVETIPVSAGVDALRKQINTQASTIEAQSAEIDELKRQVSHEFHARSMYEQSEGQRRESARAELISFVKRAHAKKLRIQAAGEPHPELDDRWRGMLDVLAKFLVVTGETDKDESHAVARRLCEVNDDEF